MTAVKDPTTFEEFWPIYLDAHSDRRTRLLHIAGTVVGLGCAAVFLATQHPVWALLAPVIAYGAAWTGHILFERNIPATFSHPLWSVRGDFRMLRLALAGRLDAEAAETLAAGSDASAETRSQRGAPREDVPPS